MSLRFGILELRWLLQGYGPGKWMEEDDKSREKTEDEKEMVEEEGRRKRKKREGEKNETF